MLPGAAVCHSNLQAHLRFQRMGPTFNLNLARATASPPRKLRHASVEVDEVPVT